MSYISEGHFSFAKNTKFLPSIVHIKWENLCLNEKVSCRPLTFVSEVSNYSKVFLSLLHYIWTFACLFVGVFFVSSWKYPLLILESFHLFVRVFNWTFSKNPPTIIGNLPYPLAGCFKKFTVTYYPSTIIETFGTKVDGLHETFFIKTKIL